MIPVSDELWADVAPVRRAVARYYTAWFFNEDWALQDELSLLELGKKAARWRDPTEADFEEDE